MFSLSHVGSGTRHINCHLTATTQKAKPGLEFSLLNKISPAGRLGLICSARSSHALENGYVSDVLRYVNALALALKLQNLTSE